MAVEAYGDLRCRQCSMLAEPSGKSTGGGLPLLRRLGRRPAGHHGRPTGSQVTPVRRHPLSLRSRAKLRRCPDSGMRSCFGKPSWWTPRRGQSGSRPSTPYLGPGKRGSGRIGSSSCRARISRVRSPIPRIHVHIRSHSFQQHQTSAGLHSCQGIVIKVQSLWFVVYVSRRRAPPGLPGRTG